MDIDPLEAFGNILLGVMFLCVLGWTIGFIENYCMPVFRGLSHVAASCFHFVADAIDGRRNRNKATYGGTTEMAEPASKTEANKVEEILLNRSPGPETAAEILSIKVGRKALITMRYYRSSKTVARHVSFIDSKLVYSFGKRMAMSTLKVSDSWEAEKAGLVKQSRADLKAVIGLQTGEIEKDDSEELAAESKEAVVSEPSVQASQSVEVAHEDESPSEPGPSPQECDDAARKAAIGIMKGDLLWHGRAERESGNGKYWQYRVDYKDESTKLVESIWGQDLKRAISSCAAKKGDKIEIFKLARKKVESVNENQDKEERFMTRFHVVNLSRKA